MGGSSTSTTQATDQGNHDLSGTAPQPWEKVGRSANIQVVDFDRNLNVNHLQQYTLWHNGWEVYVGRFASSVQDGIFIYDRVSGEARIMSFGTDLSINDYQELHNLTGNWEVHSGDFAGTGRSQVLLYDPSSGDGQMLVFGKHLVLAQHKTYSNWGTNQVFYSGHFGMANLGVMLYDPQSAKSNFMAFSSSLDLTQQYTTQSWDQNWQILVGSFVDRARCGNDPSCGHSDDILVLNRQTGQMQQYTFAFGSQVQVFDNRSQPFIREGQRTDGRLNAVDTTTFGLLGTFTIDIKNDELY